MKHNVVAPSVGESITEVSILKWAKENGQTVKAGELLLEIESDKATVEVVAEMAGVLAILKPAGERIPIGALVATIEDAVSAAPPAPSATSTAPQAPKFPPPIPASLSGLAAASGSSAPATPPVQNAGPSAPTSGPAARKAMTEAGLASSQISGTGKDGRVTSGDVNEFVARGGAPASTPATPAPMGTGATAATAPQVALPAAARGPAPAAPVVDRPGDRRVPMTMLRARIAERLVHAQHTAAILTTFNECDMSAVNALRTQHKDAFKTKHGVPLSYMSFFTRACVEALKLIPEVNASIDGRDVIYHDYYDVGIAVGSERGLVVPVVRGAGQMGFVEIEKKIGELAGKARDGKLSIADMAGGTFTISNGGTYGSLMSTPILNPPQSGILGMHKIQDRPMAINGMVEIRPMMYLALSYDHRIIDGKGAVTFLVQVKDFIEHPEKLALNY